MTQLLEIDTPHSTDDGAQPQIPHVPPEPMMARLAGMKTIVGIGGVALLLLVAFIFVFSSKSKPKVKGQAKQHAPTTQQANQPGSVTPRNEMAPTSAAQEDVVSAQDIDRTKDPNRNAAVSAPPTSGTPGVSIGGAATKVGFGRERRRQSCGAAKTIGLNSSIPADAIPKRGSTTVVASAIRPASSGSAKRAAATTTVFTYAGRAPRPKRTGC